MLNVTVMLNEMKHLFVPLCHAERSEASLQYRWDSSLWSEWHCSLVIL